MAKRKPKAGGGDNAPRMAFGASVLLEPWFHRACARATREETVATFGEEGGAVWDSIRVTQPEEAAEASPEYEVVDPAEWQAAIAVEHAATSACEDASAPATTATLAVTGDDYHALSAIADTLDFSRKDSGGDCWYCGAAGNPEPIGEHAEDCPWRRFNAFMFRVGDALAGDPPGTTTIQGGPACRCVTCGAGVWSHQAAANLLAVNLHQPAHQGDWTVAQCDAFDRASGLARLGPGVVVAEDQVDDGGNFVLCDGCTAHGLRVAEASGRLERGDWRCPRCGHGEVVDPGRGDGPECDYCGLGVGLVPDFDTQDGQEVGPQLDPRAVGVQDAGDDVPF